MESSTQGSDRNAGSESAHDLRATYSSPVSKGLNVILVCSIAAAFAGFFIGMEKPESGQKKVKSVELEVTTDVLPAVVYKEMNGIARGPNAAWANPISKLALPEPLTSVDLRKVSLAEHALNRARNRAFKGAPPTIPHRVDQQQTSSCLICHAEGKQLGDHFASIIPHGLRPNCTQCHVESRYKSVPPLLSEAAALAYAPVLGIKTEFVVQPLAFNHKRHSQADVELDCKDCHKKVYDGPSATFPKWTVCKQCHEDPKGKSTEEAKLREVYLKEKKEIPWIQMNRLPAHVVFTHTAHVKTGKIDCINCHGDMKSVAEPVTVSQIDHLTMGACMTCHQKRNVSNDCLTCHKQSSISTDRPTGSVNVLPVLPKEKP